MRRILRTLIWVLVPAIASMASHDVLSQDEELLPPEQAFASRVEALAADRVAVTWQVADGYYLYRDKLGFRTAGVGEVTAVDYPAGKIKYDEFFGESEVYLGEATFTVQLAGVAGVVDLVIDAQGCNEPVGVCYPPMSREVRLSLPVAEARAAIPEAAIGAASGTPLSTPAATPAAGGIDPVDELRGLLGDIGGSDDFLPVDEAFGLTLSATENRLRGEFRVADGYYLYQDKIHFNVVDGAARTGDPELPPGSEKEDEYFGRMIVYLSDFAVDVPLLRAAPQATRVTIEAGYQGCADEGICYPPVTRSFTLDLPALVGEAQAASAPLPGERTDDTPKGYLGFWLSAFGIGLLLTFTPCVLPMIPILSSVIVGQGNRMTRARGGILSLVYVLGTAVTYAVIGAVAGATGDQLQAYFQNLWAIGALALVFVLMALSMFGLYKVQMPSFVQGRLQQGSAGLGGGTLSMVFVLGLVSALIIGACVSPLLISLLGIAISRADPLLGASMMLFMALGMGVFLVAFGFGAGAVLPRAGAWMERVNHVFGVMLLAVAIYLLGAVPAVPVLLLWAALLTIVGIYLGATDGVPEGASGWRYLSKGVGTIALAWGLLCLVGGLAGNRDPLDPIPAGTFSAAAPAQTTEAAHFARIGTPAELDAALARAAGANRHLLLDFYADWCVDCIRMEKTTFADPVVAGRLRERFELVQVDVTDPNDAGGKAIKQQLGVYGPPAILFFENGGAERRDLRLYGYRDAEAFGAVLDRL